MCQALKIHNLIVLIVPINYILFLYIDPPPRYVLMNSNLLNINRLLSVYGYFGM